MYTVKCGKYVYTKETLADAHFWGWYMDGETEITLTNPDNTTQTFANKAEFDTYVEENA